MKCNYLNFGLLLFSCFVLLACNTDKQRSDSQVAHEKSLSSPTLYSEVIDQFLQEMKDKYDSTYKERIWEHHSDLRTKLIGSKIDEFELSEINGQKIDFEDINTPIVLEATASWCGPCIESIPIFNQLSKEYKGQLKFIMVSHDTGDKAEDYSAKFNKEITFIPSEREIDAMNPIKASTGSFKNLFPFPTAYFIDKNKIITQIKTGGVRSGTFPRGNGDTLRISKKEAFEGNMNILKNGIEDYLLTTP